MTKTATEPEKAHQTPPTPATPTPQQRAEACLADIQRALERHQCDILGIIENVLPVGRGTTPSCVQLSAGWRIVAV